MANKNPKLYIIENDKNDKKTIPRFKDFKEILFLTKIEIDDLLYELIDNLMPLGTILISDGFHSSGDNYTIETSSLDDLQNKKQFKFKLISDGLDDGNLDELKNHTLVNALSEDDNGNKLKFNPTTKGKYISHAHVTSFENSQWVHGFDYKGYMASDTYKWQSELFGKFHSYNQNNNKSLMTNGISYGIDDKDISIGKNTEDALKQKLLNSSYEKIDSSTIKNYQEKNLNSGYTPKHYHSGNSSNITNNSVEGNLKINDDKNIVAGIKTQYWVRYE